MNTLLFSIKKIENFKVSQLNDQKQNDIYVKIVQNIRSRFIFTYLRLFKRD